MPPTPIHVAIVIFLEYCVWGLITPLFFTATKEAFGSNALLLNGICTGIKVFFSVGCFLSKYQMKGILAFIFAPIIGEISDFYGRKKLLVPCVGFTCLPTVALLLNYKLFFLLFVLSGTFNASFSLTFAYVSDCTTEKYRYLSYGMVSASFAASMIVSPLLGEKIQVNYGDNALTLVSVLIALFDLIFLHYIVPESVRTSKMKKFSWIRLLNPFHVFGYVFYNKNIALLCAITLLSSIAEYGQISSIFIYLKNVINLTTHEVAIFMAFCGLLAVFSQTFVFNFIAYFYSVECALSVALIAQFIQLLTFGLFTKKIMILFAGILGSVSSIAFPCLSAMVSQIAAPEQQGIFQGLFNGVRSLCTGIGPAFFGLIFHWYGVNLDYSTTENISPNKTISSDNIFKNKRDDYFYFPGIPYLVGSAVVAVAIYLLHYKHKRNDLYPLL